jgi:hypothetical protein
MCEAEMKQVEDKAAIFCAAFMAAGFLTSIVLWWYVKKTAKIEVEQVHDDDFLIVFEPQTDITTFELATIMQATRGFSLAKGFAVEPLAPRGFAESLGASFRHFKVLNA